MRVLVTGGSGFIGGKVAEALLARGDEVVLLSRSAKAGGAVETRAWNPDAGELSESDVSGFDALVHLAGEPIIGLWTAAKRRRIRDSRVKGTKLLADTLARLPNDARPHTFISASAIGYYGNRGEEELTEASSAGRGFLPSTCIEWEQSSAGLQQVGVRVVWLRIGIVMDPQGGALKQMLLPFRLGIGGRLGSGQQWMSWISRRDLVNAILFALDSAALAGPINCTAPEALRNAEFTQQLAKALHRPAVLPAPAAALGLLPGNMADEALLASARVVPTKLKEAGFPFQDPSLSSVLQGL